MQEFFNIKAGGKYSDHCFTCTRIVQQLLFRLVTRDYKQSTRPRYNKRHAWSQRQSSCHKQDNAVTKLVILSQLV